MIYEVPIATKMPVEGSIVGLWSTRMSIFSYGIEKRKVNNRSFEVNILGENEDQIIILQNAHTTFTLNSLLPQGVTITYKQGTNYFNAPYQQVRYDWSFNKAADVFNTLHEIRHAQLSPSIVDIPKNLSSQEALIYMRPLVAKIRDGAFVSEEEQRQVYERLLYITQACHAFSWEYLYEKIYNESPPLSFVEATFAYQAVEEIECWRYAVEQAKFLESLGFNVLSDFNSEEEIQRYINSCLASYERGRYQELRRRGAVGDVYYPIFL